MTPAEKSKQLSERIVAIVADVIETSAQGEQLGGIIFFGMALAAASTATMMGVSVHDFRRTFNRMLDGIESALLNGGEVPDPPPQPRRVDVVVRSSDGTETPSRTSAPDTGDPADTIRGVNPSPPTGASFLAGIDLDSYRKQDE